MSRTTEHSTIKIAARLQKSLNSLTVSGPDSAFQKVQFSPFRPVVVSHLQFADDTLILREKSWANIRALRAVFLLFEAMSGLKVNFSKSQLVGVNVPSSWLAEAVLVLNCNVDSPFGAFFLLSILY
ncbi:hypothetical protein MTR_7g037240 [Medicago truncatula]|uniref:RNA-directed DNA polymerase n=1 Tax=Medicago truncatula TaxID=3880 RepID=G7KR95_MEDTR|nr:hypothetical protein MTR_7g037240 [Medicago truncatula]